MGRGTDLEALFQQGEGGPGEQHHDHDCRDLHDPQGFLARFLNSLGVLPPEIERHQHGEDDGRPIDVHVRRAVEHEVHGTRNPAVGVGGGEGVIDQPGDVLAGGNARDGAGQDVVEHQGGDADLGQGSAQSFLDHAVDAAADEHGAALHVDGSHREGEQHDPQDEPRGRFPDGLLGDAGGIERRGAEVIQDDGGGSPVGDEGEHHRGRDYDADAVRG